MSENIKKECCDTISKGRFYDAGSILYVNSIVPLRTCIIKIQIQHLTVSVYLLLHEYYIHVGINGRVTDSL
jgi:hypothetical protein